MQINKNKNNSGDKKYFRDNCYYFIKVFYSGILFGYFAR